MGQRKTALPPIRNTGATIPVQSIIEPEAAPFNIASDQEDLNPDPNASGNNSVELEAEEGAQRVNHS